MVVADGGSDVHIWVVCLRAEYCSQESLNALSRCGEPDIVNYSEAFILDIVTRKGMETEER
jgi:hypothetical protein